MPGDKRVVVAGDMVIEWRFARSRILHRTGALFEPGYYMQCYPGYGSAASLGHLIASAAAADPPLAQSVLFQEFKRDEMIPGRPPFWHLYVVCEQFPERVKAGSEHDEPTVWRIGQRLGTDRQQPADLEQLPDLIPGDNDAAQRADLVVIEHAYKGFAEWKPRWPKSFADPKDGAWILFRWVRPNFEEEAKSGLWRHVSEKFRDRIIVLLTIDDLRISPMRISRALTWEREIEDLDGEIRRLWTDELAACRHLIVSFHGAGAAVFSRTGRDGYTGHLYFNPVQTEDTWARDFPGLMIGYARCLTAAITLQLLNAEGPPTADAIKAGIRPGLLAAYELQRGGFDADPQYYDPTGTMGTSFPLHLKFPTKRLIPVLRSGIDGVARASSSKPPSYADHPIPTELDNSPAQSDRHKWKILRDELRERNDILRVAKQIVEHGTEGRSWRFPVMRFGQLFATDRTEIESYRAIAALMTNYMSIAKIVPPLSIAAFGSPGSGKSFGIQSVADAVAKMQAMEQRPAVHKVETLTFNLSQVSDPDAIIGALHQVRDVGLSGAMPLVFWDEFDTALGGSKLGWLRYFLAPMADGKFQAGPFIHNIGRAIFVFGGGTHKTMPEFQATANDKAFTDAKATDFISRLKGFVNVPELNYPDPPHIDPSIALRRAVLLHAFLQSTAPTLVQTTAEPNQPLVKRINIDTGLIHAFLCVGKYRYAARSMESVVKMSALSGSSMFDRSSLAPSEQLRLHVDPVEFLALIESAPAWMEGRATGRS
jgi:hypothetical protein